MGTKNDAHFRVVVIDRRSGRDGPFLEVLGHYHPQRGPERLVLDVERTKEWVSKGARMSDTVCSLLKQAETGGQARATSPSPSAGKVAAVVTEVPKEDADVTESGSAQSDKERQTAQTADEPDATATESGGASAEDALDDNSPISEVEE